MYDIQLINLFSHRTEILEDRGFVPLSLVWLGSYLQKYGYSVGILDAQRDSLEEIAQKLNSKIVGFNYTIMSTDMLDQATAIAKKNGATVVVGGQGINQK
jgi:hypothetical protein